MSPLPVLGCNWGEGLLAEGSWWVAGGTFFPLTYTLHHWQNSLCSFPTKVLPCVREREREREREADRHRECMKNSIHKVSSLPWLNSHDKACPWKYRIQWFSNSCLIFFFFILSYWFKGHTLCGLACTFLLISLSWYWKGLDTEPGATVSVSYLSLSTQSVPHPLHPQQQPRNGTVIPAVWVLCGKGQD